MKSKRGILITLEGNEGCGKSTQIRLLYDFLRKKGRKVFLTREPGGTRIGDKIRKILLDRKNMRMTPVCETLLYMASRAQLVEEVILPRLKKGEIVLCDRWLDATVAYQGYAGGVDVEWIKRLGCEATRGVVPRLSLYLDLPVAIGLRRATTHKKADRMERKNILFHQKVRRGFLKIAQTEPKRFRRIPLAEKDTIEVVQAKILREVVRVL
jgi:dTMP kinase